MLRKIERAIELIFIITIIFLLIAPFILDLKPHNEPSGPSLVSPSSEHILGTDDLGIDVFSQLVYGTKTTIFLSLTTALISGLGGSTIGIISGYIGGKFDSFILSIIDIMMAIPDLPLMIVLGAFLGPGIKNIIIVIALVSWTMPAKIARSQVLKLRNEKYIVLSRAYGGSFFFVFKNHIFKSIFPVLMASIMKIMNRAVLSEATLAFLGLGDPLSKSWGMLLTRAMSFPNIYFTPFYKWWLVPPLLLIVLFVTTLAMLSRNIERNNFRKIGVRND